MLIKIPWGGIGVSNSKLLFENEYARLELDKQHMPNQPHNQFLTLWLNHGVFALMFFLLALIILFLRIKTTPYKVGATCFLGLFLASCLTEDTLNSQPGVGIATVFVLLYFFILPNEQKASLAEENSPPPKL
jgi:O-antigen ligase